MQAEGARSYADDDADGAGRSVWRVDIAKARVTLLDVALFAEQFRALISAGIPVNESLSLLSRATRGTAPRLADALVTIRRDVEEGHSLGGAFRRHEPIFGRLAVEMIATGEATGTLERTLADLADDCEHRHRNRATVVSALVEPALVIVLGIAVSYILVTVTVPQFKSLFAGLTGANRLPLPTQFVIAASDFLVSPAGLAATLAAVLAAGGLALAVARSEGLRYRFDSLMLRVPIVGDVALVDAVGRACRTLAVVHRSIGEIPIAIALAVKTTPNLRVAAAFQQVGEDVYDGRMLWEAMRDTAVIPELCVYMTKSGEESGQLDTLLMRLADNCETSVRYRRERMLTVLRNGLLVVMGGLVLFLMLAMYLPVFTLIDQMRR